MLLIYFILIQTLILLENYINFGNNMKPLIQQNPVHLVHKIIDIDKKLWGFDYLKELVKNVASLLNVKYVLIGHPTDETNSKIETDIVWANNNFSENIVYELKDTPCCDVLCDDKICYIDNNLTKMYPKDEMLVHMGIKSYIGAPTTYRNKKLSGLLVILDDKPLNDKIFYETIIQILALHITSVMERIEMEKTLRKEIERSTKELKETNNKLKESLNEIEKLKENFELKSRLDPLTKINNKIHFTQLAVTQLKIAQRYNQDVSLLFLDLDHFKKINDTYGHMVGDFVLKETVLRIKECIRESDILARFGGEEFILLSVCTKENDDYNLAERIRKKISEKPIESKKGKINITISIGLTSTKNKIYNLKKLIQQADKALYEAKNAGRNNTVIFSN